jgi:hypothetical protein
VKTAIFDEGQAAADADVQRIIAANLGRPAAVAATARPQTRAAADRPAALARAPSSAAAH